MYNKIRTRQAKDKQLNILAFTCLIKYSLLVLIATLLTLSVAKSPAWALPEIKSGECLPGEIETPSSMESYTFYGEADQAVVITATKSSGTLWPEVFLYAPDGTLEISSYNTQQARIDNHNLSQTGWFTIVVEDRSGSLTGPFNLCLLIMPGATSRGQIDSGQCKDGIIGQNMESYTFYGETGQAVVITATKSSGTVAWEAFLYAPDGTREV